MFESTINWCKIFNKLLESAKKDNVLHIHVFIVLDYWFPDKCALNFVSLSFGSTFFLLENENAILLRIVHEYFLGWRIPLIDS